MTFPEGTGRIICDPDLDKPDVVNGNGDPGDPDFGAYVGQSIWVPPTDSSIPTFAIGLSDLSIELVIIPRSGDPEDVEASELQSIAGICDGSATAGDAVAGITNIIGDGSFLRFLWLVGGTPGSVTIIGYRPRNTWSHLCCNYDRDGNMEMFDNNVSVGVFDISGDVGVNVPAHGIYPMIGSSSILGITDDITDDPKGIVIPWFSPLAGFAIHSRILTPAEIATNNTALNTGDYPETEVRYNFRTFVDGLGARVDPPGDTNQDNISVANKWTVPPVPYGAELFSPEGANGTLHIEDLSGKDKDFGLQTLASYDDTDIANRGKVSFTITGRDFVEHNPEP